MALQLDNTSLPRKALASIYYHNIFNYPLNEKELKTWAVGNKVLGIFPKVIKVDFLNGNYFIESKSTLVKTKFSNSKYSSKKIEIAKKAASILSKIPFIKFVGLTGAVAMNNAGKDSDIDLIIITKKNTLWISRALVYLMLIIYKVEVRKPGLKDEKDKLCLNLWLDENDLIWGKGYRNIYTAHEICQIKILKNKDNTWNKFIVKNLWIKGYWPKALNYRLLDKNCRRKIDGRKEQLLDSFCFLINNVFFIIQKLYMWKKLTNESINSTRAVFHPIDLSRLVKSKLEGI